MSSPTGSMRRNSIRLSHSPSHPAWSSFSSLSADWGTTARWSRIFFLNI